MHLGQLFDVIGIFLLLKKSDLQVIKCFILNIWLNHQQSRKSLSYSTVSAISTLIKKETQKGKKILRRRDVNFMSDIFTGCYMS